MSAQNTFCCANAGNCPAIVTSCNRRPTWYTRLVKSFAFCVITSMLAMSVSHLCDKYSASTSFQMIQADLGNLRAHLGTLSLEVKNVMEMRDELKSKLKEVGSVIPKMSEAILNLRNEVSEEMSLHTKNLLKALSPETVKNMVKNELQTYDADKTGRTDYALESSGDCWAFEGSSGSVVIRLLGYVHVSGVSLEHISSSISPTGETDTAPKDFSVWGLTDVEDKQPFAFGRFTYDNTGPPLQYFEVQERANKVYDIIELKVHSNSGNPEYTCIYRIRVHGTLNPLRK